MNGYDQDDVFSLLGDNALVGNDDDALYSCAQASWMLMLGKSGWRA